MCGVSAPWELQSGEGLWADWGGLWGLLGLVVNVYFSVSNPPPGPRESWGPQAGHPRQREGQCKGPEAGLILRADPFSVLRPLPLQSARSLACSGC